MTINYFNKTNFGEVIDLAKKNLLSDDDIIFISKKMANSGEFMSYNFQDFADIPSTGGPSSLSTLICPYLFIEFGMKVPKLGVKGRPAGGIDVMAQIQDYKISFSIKEIKRVLNDCGYCHFIADSKFAPLDADFFKFRSENKAKAIPSLVIASILSKKLAVGINNLGIDIRYFNGANFGQTYEDARENALRFITIAKELDIHCTAFLCDLSNPLQPYIGRGEALLALYKILQNDMDSWLKSHFDDCLRMTAHVVSKENLKEIRFENLMHNFRMNLQAQGSKLEYFEEKVYSIQNTKRYPINSKSTGFLNVNLNLLRNIIVKYQQIDTGNQFSDKTGLILVKQGGEFVMKGDCLATLRFLDYKSNYDLNRVIQEFESVFQILSINRLENFENIIKL